MLATLVDRPFHLPGWIYEEKYDGIRLLAYKDGRRVQLLSRNDKDRTADFPGIVRAIAGLPASTLTLDGEAVVFDAAKVSRFGLLQQGATGRVVYAVFDCLYVRGHDLRALPLARRRAALEAEVREDGVLRLARRLAEDGHEAFREAARLGLEGIVAKDRAAPYQSGVRSPAWRKVKVRNEDEFVVGGFTAPGGSRTHLGALLLGGYEGDRLRYAGKVGSGFSTQALGELARRLAPLVRPASPFADLARQGGARWVEPRLVVQIAFTERTGDGRLRHPVFLGLRDDKEPREVAWRPGP
jgi:DNA ligase D-like protein (predicted ligase)